MRTLGWRNLPQVTSLVGHGATVTNVILLDTFHRSDRASILGDTSESGGKTYIQEGSIGTTIGITGNMAYNPTGGSSERIGADVGADVYAEYTLTSLGTGDSGGTIYLLCNMAVADNDGVFLAVTQTTGAAVLNEYSAGVVNQSPAISGMTVTDTSVVGIRKTGTLVQVYHNGTLQGTTMTCANAHTGTRAYFGGNGPSWRISQFKVTV